MTAVRFDIGVGIWRFAIGLALTLGVAEPATAAPLPNDGSSLSYTVVDQDLRDLLAEIGQKIGVRTAISDAVKGRVRGRLPTGSTRDFLDRLARIYGFEWYYDGSTLAITTPSESVTHMVQLGSVDIPQLNSALRELQFSDTRFALRGSDDAGVVVVSGPPRYVQIVEQTLAALAQRSRPPQDVRVFRGQVASR